MKILITGVSGFAGKHLAELALEKKNVELFGISRSLKKFEAAFGDQKNKVHFSECDLLSAKAVKSTLSKIKPDRIFHLAGQSYVPTSITFPQETLSENILGQLNILEAVRALELKPLIHIAGSAAVYGNVPKSELPIREISPFRPTSPYAVSKAAQQLLSVQYFKSFGLKIIHTNAFSHIGPGQDERFAASSFAKQIALIEVGRQKPVIQVGNLHSQKDFTDVRDMVSGYWLALEKGAPGQVYNICSGKTLAIKDILNGLVRLSSVRIKLHVDPKRVRSYDISVLKGDASKFQKATGWKPKIAIQTTLKDLLEDWRRQVHARTV